MNKIYKYEAQLTSDGTAGKLLRLVGTHKTVLEIGCSSGSQTKVMAEMLQCRVTGIEINGEAAKEAEPYCQRLIVGNIESLPLKELFGEEVFDVILLADVLEHLYDPGSALRKLLPLLADEGYVLASIPNIAHAAIVYELAHGRFDYRDMGLLDDTHIRFFTLKSIHRLFESAGFTVAHLDRVEVAPTDTEFRIQVWSDTQRRFLRYIEQNNPESHTYQYIVKAYPSADGSTPRLAWYEAQEQIRSLQDRIAWLEDQVAQREARMRVLESQITWLDNRPLRKWLRSIRGALSSKWR
ncbi:class I SAM-dependent methyltransferase [Candidatus Methylocalor cossyra]|uniref:Methyltransferase domain-containing protein n=1 Tax=Candidatus Methylocalor cossyra TaxID=3108543 RepID=A0ABM9NHG2_9GAMM